MKKPEEFKPEVPKSDFNDLDNLCQCECGNWSHHHYARQDGGGNNACPECTITFRTELIEKLSLALRKLTDSDEDAIDIIKQQHAEITGATVQELTNMWYFDDLEILPKTN